MREGMSYHIFNKRSGLLNGDPAQKLGGESTNMASWIEYGTVSIHLKLPAIVSKKKNSGKSV